MEPRAQFAFSVWVTGLPASGKSTVVASLKAQLAARGLAVAVLESDELRQVLTPEAHYDDKERDIFYRQMASLGALLTRQGVPVLFDATANRRAYRERARQEIPRFLEVHLDTPLEVCLARDPKGIYRTARESATNTVPGLHAVYEPPEHPDLVIHGDRESPESAAQSAVEKLIEKGYLACDPHAKESGSTAPKRSEPH